MNDTPLCRGGLYQPSFEKDSCGFGLIAQMDGKPSHWLVNTAIGSLACLTHRGAISPDGKTGDGCGLLLGKPNDFLRAVGAEAGLEVADSYAAGNLFLNTDAGKAAAVREALERNLLAEGLTVAGWRVIPTNPEALGEEALASMPRFEQVFVNAPADMLEDHFEGRLFVARRRTEMAIKDDPMFYIASLSTRVISYKGLMMPANLPVFYPDLQDERLSTHVAVFHQRFSTNTLPQWRLAQPFRYLAHNGEINTVQGNRNWSIARTAKFDTDHLPELKELTPLVRQEGSDSESLDNMLDTLVAGGMDLFRASRLLIPPAWQNVANMDADLRAFYEYNSMHMEPWDGPAGIVMTDGRFAACTMDRNGLRPARWVITKDRHITLASEIGVYGYTPAEVESKGRLKPGQMLAVDTRSGELLTPERIDDRLKGLNPYKHWLADNTQRVRSNTAAEDSATLLAEGVPYEIYEKQFQLTYEEKSEVLRVLATMGQEATGSMGDDTPFPVLSRRVRSLYDYFRQQFAQVTNPPIDPLRENIVMSLETCLGAERNVFADGEEHATRAVIDSPVLAQSTFHALIDEVGPNIGVTTISLSYARGGNLREALLAVCEQAEASVRDGRVLIVLSDRNLAEDMLPIHALLATGAVHHHLIDKGLRCDANIIVETATARDSHHFAVLIGYGATAVYPYLAYASIDTMVRSDEIKGRDALRLMGTYRKGINKGLFKILSKMGISTIASYRGAQLFEAVGLHPEVTDLCFIGTTCRIKGTGFDELAADQLSLAKQAWNPRKSTQPGGLLKFIFGSEYHAYNPDVVTSLQKAVKSGDYRDYQVYAGEVNNRPPVVLRDLLKLRTGANPIAVDQVEPAEAIMARFDSAGMSLGALSPEAHEALATAMNRLGGRSNSGEGGEDPVRYSTEKMSKIKQVASGRFGVTPHYLVNAEVLQIKIAQGAKPGEGGQLPGDKVNPLIAKLRYATPGVALISPPPHHDIYSIEDLAQLIYDLKQVNPRAMVSVKLVAEAGVGTIAAGVAKAYADLITIAGYDGGTGASPLTSVKYAGSPWELGLSETQQVLRANNLRDKVRVQTDGGLKTGLDVIKAAILGAESFGFGTGPMIAMGCKYLRICHLNNCATGIATQDQTLREQHFIGLPEMIMNYFRFIAQEARELMADLGVARFEDLIGRTDLLEALQGVTAKQARLDLSPILEAASGEGDAPRFCGVERNEPYDKGELAEQMVRDCLPAIEAGSGGEFRYEIRNVNRSIGARLSGEIAQRWGNQGMADKPIEIRLTGSAGQSFGVWNAGGLRLVLEGDANDYVGKGMAGGKIAIFPHRDSSFRSQDSTIIGNTCLYGATGGKLFASGLAGERFAVRNSGAIAVVEGVGDHGCEYMTGGVVVVLGPVGHNFGAGMTGGFSYVLDSERCFPRLYNNELVDLHAINTEDMDEHRRHLRELIEEFVSETGSLWGQEILHDFVDYVGHFWLVKPKAAEIDTLLETLLHRNE